MKHFLFLLFFTAFLSPTFGQKSSDSISKKTKDKKIELRIMPYLSYNRNLEFMFGAIPMMMYKVNQNDSISPKSLSGLSAIYTTNKSYALAFFNKWYLDQDKWRLKFFFFTGNQNSQFYVDDIDQPDFYDYGTKTTVLSLGGQRKIFGKFYGGLSYTFAHYNTTYQNDINPASVSHSNALVVNLLYDTRDEVYYPTKGYKIKLDWSSYPDFLDNDLASNRISFQANTYFPNRNGKDVIAARVYGKFGLGNVAFEQQSTIGGIDIRGYSEGKYRGSGLMDIQGEYRYNFGKMGLVGFAGLATIYGSDTPNFDWKLYPGAGIGYRYNPFKKSKFNVGLDGAVGKGDWGIYFRIGEAF
ncbi:MULTISPECIES: BamA/TamA family outer membrane protein [Flavobacterium]|uniref:BamA/TamA family outer membrane protein n=1 Tax=Flavobacterium TaxID=237 RepID=UPI001183151D|nr:MULTISPECIES: BamA/TamA family outer membrane protein [Flavobacterium]MCR4029878.1 outer membrane protein assembly factor [Flavobacterium panacis]